MEIVEWILSTSITIVLTSEVKSFPHKENGEITIVQTDCTWLQVEFSVFKPSP